LRQQGDQRVLTLAEVCPQVLPHAYGVRGLAELLFEVSAICKRF